MWTQEIPVQNGYYWLRHDHDWTPGIVQVMDGHYRVFGHYVEWEPITASTGWWQGPILLPKEK